VQAIRFHPGALSDDLWLDLYEQQTSGVVENDDEVIAYFPNEAQLRPFLQRWSSQIREVFEVDQTQPERLDSPDWEGFAVGERFFITADRTDEPAPAGRFTIVLSPSNAFGTGRHETTQLMLEWMESAVQDKHVIIDVGCGTGILAKASLLLGATAVYGCDIDEAAVRGAADFSGAPCFVGSADALRAQSADIVLANISARVIDRLAGNLKRLTKPGGLIVASGFLRDNGPKLLLPTHVYEKGEWQCWVCRPEDISPGPEDIGHALQHEQNWW
jgi:ribosomal protein L11 methylase PrmA